MDTYSSLFIFHFSLEKSKQFSWHSICYKSSGYGWMGMAKLRASKKMNVIKTASGTWTHTSSRFHCSDNFSFIPLLLFSISKQNKRKKKQNGKKNFYSWIQCSVYFVCSMTEAMSRASETRDTSNDIACHIVWKGSVNTRQMDGVFVCMYPRWW